MEKQTILASTASAASAASTATTATTALKPAPPPFSRLRLGSDFFGLIPALVDAMLVLAAFEIARQAEALVFGQARPFPWISACAYTLLLAIAMYLNEMYSFWQPRHTSELSTGILRCQGLALILVAPALYLFPGLMGRWFFSIALASQFLLIVLWRRFLEQRLIGELGRQRVLIVGSGERARRIREALASRGQLIFDLVGCTLDRGGDESGRSARYVGNSVDVCEVARSERIDHVIVAQDNPRNVFPVDALLRLKNGGVAITEGEYFYEHLMGKLLTDYVRPSVLIFSASPRQHTIQIWLKRLIDIAVASVLLALTTPLMLLFAILVKLTSAGPALYNQERVGLGGENFTIYKFRSMRADAEKDGAKWAAANDSRVTPVGRFMRKTRIDELPQLVNVLKGEMSMVGPRPERPQFVEKLRQDIPFYEMRHMMRPGLSGWAQVRYRYGSSIEDAHEKLRYDLYYIKNYSIFLDLTILLETTKVVLFGSGAR